jgi:hypothetical protein
MPTPRTKAPKTSTKPSETPLDLNSQEIIDKNRQLFHNDSVLVEELIEELQEIVNKRLDRDRLVGAPRQSVISALFERLSVPALPLPTQAPELYKDRSDRDETVETFVRRVYGQWLEQPGGLPRPILRTIDEPCYRALYKQGIPDDLAALMPTARGKAAKYIGMSDTEILQQRKAEQRDRTRRHLRRAG